MFGLHAPPYGLVRTVDPVEEPLALADVQAWVRSDPGNAADNAKLSGLIVAARIEGERVSGRRFCVSTWRMTLDRFPPYHLHGRRTDCGYPDASGFGYVGVGPHWPAIRLPGPATAVLGVNYYDVAETLQALDMTTTQFSGDYAPSLLVVRYPPVTFPRPDAVQITFTAGRPAAGLGANVKTALMMAVAQWYESAGDDADPGAWAETMPRRSVGILRGENDGELSYGR